MKARKVMVHLELKSNLPLREILDKTNWQGMIKSYWRYDYQSEVHQISVQVVKEGK